MSYDFYLRAEHPPSPLRKGEVWEATEYALMVER